MIMNYPEDMVYINVPVILTVSDGQATDSQTVTVKVTNYWPPEIIQHLPDVSQ